MRPSVGKDSPRGPRQARTSSCGAPHILGHVPALVRSVRCPWASGCLAVRAGSVCPFSSIGNVAAAAGGLGCEDVSGCAGHLLPLEQAGEGVALGASAGRAPSFLLGVVGALGYPGWVPGGRDPVGLHNPGWSPSPQPFQEETSPLGPLSAKAKVTGGKAHLEFGTG